MKIKEIEHKLFYEEEEVKEINEEFKKVCKPGVDYSEAGNEYKVGYINAKVNRLARGLPLHGENTKPIKEKETFINSFGIEMTRQKVELDVGPGKKYIDIVDKVNQQFFGKPPMTRKTKRKMNYHYENANRKKPFPEEVSNYMGEDDSINNQPRKFKRKEKDVGKNKEKKDDGRVDG